MADEGVVLEITFRVGHRALKTSRLVSESVGLALDVPGAMVNAVVSASDVATEEFARVAVRHVERAMRGELRTSIVGADGTVKVLSVVPPYKEADRG